MKLKEDLRAFTDDSRTTELFRIMALQRFDPRARYDITEPAGEKIGQLAKLFGRSLTSASRGSAASNGFSDCATAIAPTLPAIGASDQPSARARARRRHGRAAGALAHTASRAWSSGITRAVAVAVATAASSESKSVASITARSPAEDARSAEDAPGTDRPQEVHDDTIGPALLATVAP
jgi:hypothetical protein